jgi:hypothetical protein
MFAVDDAERVKHLAEMEKMCDVYDLDRLRDLCDRLVAAGGGDSEAVRVVFLGELERLNARLGQERAKVTELSRGGPAAADGKSAGQTKVRLPYYHRRGEGVVGIFWARIINAWPLWPFWPF